MSAAGQVPRPTLLARDLGPWQPDIDSRRSDKPQIISGRNFRDGVDGPFSGWSSEFANWNLLDTSTRAKITELRLDEYSDIFYGTPTGVYAVDKISGVMYCVLHITVTNIYWPWTIAYVGGMYYLAQYDIGLYQYDPINKIFSKLSTPNGSTVRFAVENNGRLVLFTDTVISNSSLDDGTDFIPDLASGAGAEALSIGGGTPYRIESISDGILVFTTAGIIKGNFTTNAYVYSYKGKFSKAIKLFNPNASCYVAGLGIVSLDINGLFLTREYNYETQGYPQPWEIEKSDYIKKNIIVPMDKTKLGVIGMYYSQSLQVLFIYFSSNIQQGFFQTTFCYEFVSKRWGSFDQAHYGIFEVLDPITNTYTAAYLDANGYMQEFSNTNFTEDYPPTGEGINDFIYRPLQTDIAPIGYVDPAISAGKQVISVFTEILQSDRNPFNYHTYTQSNLYQINSGVYSDTANNADEDPAPAFGIVISVGTYINMDYSGAIEHFALPYLLPEIGLDSNIQIGPFRFNDQQTMAEQQSLVESLLLGMKGTDSFIIYEDWNTLNGNEDWNSLTGNEDWGQGSTAPNLYELTLRDTDDGFSMQFQGDETLIPYSDLGSSQLFKPEGNCAIYHNLTIAAENVGEAYNLKTVDITLQPTGVYQNA
jgi:hypothetical protein